METLHSTVNIMLSEKKQESGAICCAETHSVKRKGAQ